MPLFSILGRKGEWGGGLGPGFGSEGAAPAHLRPGPWPRRRAVPLANSGTPWQKQRHLAATPGPSWLRVPGALRATRRRGSNFTSRCVLELRLFIKTREYSRIVVRMQLQQNTEIEFRMRSLRDL